MDNMMALLMCLALSQIAIALAQKRLRMESRQRSRFTAALKRMDEQVLVFGVVVLIVAVFDAVVIWIRIPPGSVLKTVLYVGGIVVGLWPVGRLLAAYCTGRQSSP